MFRERAESCPTGRPIYYPNSQHVDVEYRQHPSATLHCDTLYLEIVGHRIYTYAKKLNILKPKIVRKRNKATSKLLKKCENDYDEIYTTLVATVKELNKLIPTTFPEQDEGGFSEAAERHRPRQIPHAVQNWSGKGNTKREIRVIDLSRSENKVSQLELEVVRLKEQLQQRDDANIRTTKDAQEKWAIALDHAHSKVCELQEKVKVLSRQLKIETEAKDDTTRQLIELLALRENNPIKVEVSDKIRPTKIAAQVSELYDNEWTDAVDELKQERYKDEAIAAQQLLDIFMDVYHECQRISTDGFLYRIKACIEHSDVLQLKKGSSDVELPEQFRQQVHEIRKSVSAANIDAVVDGILNQRSLSYLRNTAQKKRLYVRKCANLSWMMCIQDPPMVPSTHTGREFNNTLFREYTKKGLYVDYVVWPVIYLHEGGPVLCKGVAKILEI